MCKNTNFKILPGKKKTLNKNGFFKSTNREFKYLRKIVKHVILFFDTV